jgi:hypothetical protein
MKIIGRVFRLLGGGLMLASIVGAIAAVRARADQAREVSPEADEIELNVILQPTAFKSTATSFRGGTITCWYGGGIIDLREAVLNEAGAVLKVRAIFGGAQILVPESWDVTTKVVGIGGIADGRRHVERPEDAPKLTIEGTAIFGGFALASEITDAEAKGLADAVARWAKARKAPALSEVAAPAA